MTLTFPDDWKAEVLTAERRPIMLKVRVPRSFLKEERDGIKERIETEFARKGQPCPPIVICSPGIDITLEYPDDCV